MKTGDVVLFEDGELGIVVVSNHWNTIAETEFHYGGRVIPAVRVAGTNTVEGLGEL